jgi:hypothetical protein
MDVLGCSYSFGGLHVVKVLTCFHAHKDLKTHHAECCSVLVV